MENVQRISLDIMNNKSYKYAFTKQYDVGRILEFVITEDDQPMNLNNCTAIFSLKKPSGYMVLDEVPISNNVITVKMTDQMSGEYGKIPYQLSLCQDTTFPVSSMGNTTTTLSNGATTNPIVINGENRTAFTGYWVTDPTNHKYVWDGKQWKTYNNESTVTAQQIISTITGYIMCEKAPIQNDDYEAAFKSNIVNVILESVSLCRDYADNAKSSENNAKSYAATASDQAIEAKSYAVGGTNKTHSYTSGGVTTELDDDVDNSKYYMQWSKSYAIGEMGYQHDDGTGTGTTITDDVDNSRYYCNQARSYLDQAWIVKTAVLPAANWSNNTQTINVQDITADESHQLIVVRPAENSMQEYLACDVMCTHQDENSLTFTCDSVHNPTNNLTIYLVVQRMSADLTAREVRILYSSDEPSSQKNHDIWIKPYT